MYIKLWQLPLRSSVQGIVTLLTKQIKIPSNMFFRGVLRDSVFNSWKIPCKMSVVASRFNKALKKVPEAGLWHRRFPWTFPIFSEQPFCREHANISFWSSDVCLVPAGRISAFKGAYPVQLETCLKANKCESTYIFL